MVKRITTLFIIVFLLWGCKEEVDFPLPKDFPWVKTLEYQPLNIDKVVLKGEMVFNRSKDIPQNEVDYGFIVESEFITDTFLIGTSNQSLSFEFVFNEIFLKQTILSYKAFAKIDSSIYMGNREEAIMGRVFEIHEVIPAKAVWQDTVVIMGSRLGSFPDDTQVFFRNTLSADIIAIDTNYIEVVVPKIPNSGTYNLKIVIAGQTLTVDGLFQIAAPEITGFYPEYGFEGDTITISGNYFGQYSTSNPSETFVSLGWHNGWVYLQVISWKPDEIKVLLNDINKRIDNPIIVNHLNNQGISQNSFFMVNPWKQLGSITQAHTIKGSRGFSINGYGMLGNRRYRRYNPHNDSWSNTSGLIGQITDYASSWIVNNRAFIVASHSSFSPNTYEIYEFRPSGSMADWDHIGSYILSNYIKEGHTSAVANNRAFFLTGNPLDPYAPNFFEIDPEYNLWEPAPQFPGGLLRYAIGLEINGMAYFGTGLQNEGYSNLFYRYDPNAQTWSQMADFPVSMHSGIGFSIDGMGYAGMGHSNSDITYDRSIYSYDPQLDTWKWVASFPNNEITNYSFVFTIGNVAYIGSTQSNNNFFQFDPAYLKENYQHDK